MSGRALADRQTSSALADRQTWSAAGYAENARFVSDLGGEIFSWLAPQPGERILDVGCGDGALTARIRDAGASVLGIDASDAMVAAAQARGLDAQNLDVLAMDFADAFDAVFSNAVLHWVTEPDRAARAMRRALHKGGRLVAEFGGHGNVAAIVTAMRAAARRHGGDPALAAPWFYPTPGEYQALLEGAGFAVQRVELAPRPTPLPTGMEGWLATFRQPFFDQFGPDRGHIVLAEVVDLLRPSLCDRAGTWTADYVRLRVAARAV